MKQRFGFVCPVMCNTVTDCQQCEMESHLQITKFFFLLLLFFTQVMFYFWISLYWQDKHIQYLEVSNIEYLEIKLRFLYVLVTSVFQGSQQKKLRGIIFLVIFFFLPGICKGRLFCEAYNELLWHTGITMHIFLKSIVI